MKNKMVKCKFCKNQAFVSVKKYGYNRIAICSECFRWALTELEEFKEVSP